MENPRASRPCPALRLPGVTGPLLPAPFDVPVLRGGGSHPGPAHARSAALGCASGAWVRRSGGAGRAGGKTPACGQEGGPALSPHWAPALSRVCLPHVGDMRPPTASFGRVLSVCGLLGACRPALCGAFRRRPSPRAQAGRDARWWPRRTCRPPCRLPGPQRAAGQRPDGHAGTLAWRHPAGWPSAPHLTPPARGDRGGRPAGYGARPPSLSGRALKRRGDQGAGPAGGP